jgi:hypothetical protein
MEEIAEYVEEEQDAPSIEVREDGLSNKTNFLNRVPLHLFLSRKILLHHKNEIFFLYTLTGKATGTLQ